MSILKKNFNKKKETFADVTTTSTEPIITTSIFKIVSNQEVIKKINESEISVSIDVIKNINNNIDKSIKEIIKEIAPDISYTIEEKDDYILVIINNTKVSEYFKYSLKIKTIIFKFVNSPVEVMDKLLNLDINKLKSSNNSILNIILIILIIIIILKLLKI